MLRTFQTARDSAVFRGNILAQKFPSYFALLLRKLLLSSYEIHNPNAYDVNFFLQVCRALIPEPPPCVYNLQSKVENWGNDLGELSPQFEVCLRLFICSTRKVYKTKFLLHRPGPPVYWVCAGSFSFSVSFLLNFRLSPISCLPGAVVSSHISSLVNKPQLSAGNFH